MARPAKMPEMTESSSKDRLAAVRAYRVSYRDTSGATRDVVGRA